MRKIILLGSCVAVVCAAHAAAWAQCTPDPSQSTFPGCMSICPRGDIPVTAVIRDASGNPCGGVTIALTLVSTCANALCHVDGATTTYRAVSRPNGLVNFTSTPGGFRVGGCCDPSVQFIDVASGTVLAQSNVAARSPDMNASCNVDLLDVSAFVPDFQNGATFCADLNCDGSVNLNDVTLLSIHMGH